jgi:transposase
MSEYVGFDVSEEETSFCVKDVSGEILARGKVATDPVALFEVLRAHCVCPERIVLETGTLSGWLSRELGKLGIAVEVIDARQAHAVMKLQHNKTDANDAALLAEIARTGFCRPVCVESEAAQADRILLKAQAHLVGQGRATQNTIRGLLGSLGIRFAKGSGKRAGLVREALEGRDELRATIDPLLRAAAALEREIARLDKAVSGRAKDDPAVRLLMTVPGIGPVTALAFAATIGDAERFAKSRTVGAYIGLTSRRWQSGEMDYVGAHLQVRRRDAARAALRGRQQPVDGGAQGPSAEGLGAPDQEADQSQEGLRDVGAQAGGNPASHDDHRRAFPLAAKGGRRVNQHE